MTTFIALSKTLPQLFLPVGLCLLLQALALALCWRRRRRAALAVGVLALLMLWLPSTPRIAEGLLSSLEQRHPARLAAASESADVIIVLGGGTTGRSRFKPEVDLGPSGSRLLHGFRLYKAGKAPLLLLSGGSLWTRPTEAEQMRGVLSEWGVPDGAMILEDESRNTRENAVASLRLMQQRGLRRALLVTSAFHMPRALAIFQKEAARLSAQAAGPVASGEERGVAAQQQGAGALTIIPAATGVQVSGEHPYTVIRWLPEVGALACSTLALHERMGILIYALRGWL